jgi:HD-like signal output (HDOD) protein/DNA-binding CsgD family transcriptional regulator
VQRARTRQLRSSTQSAAAHRATASGANATAIESQPAKQAPAQTPRLHAVKPSSERPRANRAAGASEEHLGGRAQRLTKAFQALESFPALADSRERLEGLLVKDPVPMAEVVATVESDAALALRVLSLANERAAASEARIDTVGAALELLGTPLLHALASRVPTFDFFERSPLWDVTPERFRLHALASQRATDLLAVETGYGERDRLTAVSLLHDVGKLVLTQAYPGYPRLVEQSAGTPEQRLHQERRELGVDHTLMGGVVARRLGLPASITSAIERHHNLDAEGDAALLRLGDMLAHYQQGTHLSPVAMLAAARTIGIDPARLRSIMYELPGSGSQRPRHVDPCPLSPRELGVLQKLAEGKVYKQIAHELALSTSTVRTHLHNIYGKLGAVDRAQAVLIANQRGWL